MRCLHHPLNKVIGYCHVCGTFGCAQCLTEHEGNLYCKKDYKPIADELAHKAKLEKSLARKDRQRLVVRLKDGETVRGSCYSLNPAVESMHLDLVDDLGQPVDETRQIDFADCKAVFFVKSYDGKFDSSHHYHDLHEAGAPIVVEFADGEILFGNVTATYNPREARFYVLPEVKDTNNLLVLVERSAAKALYTPQQYKERKQQEAEAYVEDHVKEGHGRDEAHGDFHFEKGEYLRAMKYYRAAQREAPDSARIRKKIVSTQYNIGIGQIKHHEYREALASMKAVLEMDPDNERAQDKAAKLREMIKRHAHEHTSKTPK